MTRPNRASDLGHTYQVIQSASLSKSCGSIESPFGKTIDLHFRRFRNKKTVRNCLFSIPVTLFVFPFSGNVYKRFLPFPAIEPQSFLGHSLHRGPSDAIINYSLFKPSTLEIRVWKEGCKCTSACDVI